MTRRAMRGAKDGERERERKKKRIPRRSEVKMLVVDFEEVSSSAKTGSRTTSNSKTAVDTRRHTPGGAERTSLLTKTQRGERRNSPCSGTEHMTTHRARGWAPTSLRVHVLTTHRVGRSTQGAFCLQQIIQDTMVSKRIAARHGAQVAVGAGTYGRCCCVGVAWVPVRSAHSHTRASCCS